MLIISKFPESIVGRTNRDETPGPK